METIRRVLALPYRLVRAVVDTLGRAIAGVLGCAIMTVGLVVALELDLPWVGLGIGLVGLILVGRAIA